MGSVVPAGIPANVSWSPPIVITDTFPVPPIYKKQPVLPNPACADEE